MLYKHNILGGIWMIDNEYVANYLPLVTNYLKGESVPVQLSSQSGSAHEELSDRNSLYLITPKNGAYKISEYGERVKPENAPENSIAVIEINGVITKYDQECGPAGMATKANLLKRCYQNSNITSIVLKIDSGGGEGYGMMLLNETISEKNKPVYAFVDDFAASAAYGIASACDKIFCNSAMAMVGSIGTYSTIVDFKGYYEKHGIKLHEIYASASSEKNKDFIEALNGNYEPLRARINQFNDHFLSLVSKGRGELLKSDSKVWGTGKVFKANEAMKIGLIDEISSFDNMISEIGNNFSTNNKHSVQMKKQPLKVNAVLKVDQLESTDDGVFLNEDQIHSVDAELDRQGTEIQNLTSQNTSVTEQLQTANTTIEQRDAQIVQLNDQIKNLKAGAGASTRGIVTEADATIQTTDDISEIETASSAMKLFNLLP
jgi:signal peptide peptidase SppA